MRAFLITACILLAVFAASPLLLVKLYFYTEDIFLGAQSIFVGHTKPDPTDLETIRFTGDVMLARHVETLMNQYGSAYPYQQISTPPNTSWVGNFEAAVPDDHVKTKDFTLKFSVDTKHLSALKDFGMTHLSLANNHSYDFGEEGFSETKDNLSAFTTFGDPNGVTGASVTKIDVKGGTIGVVALHAVVVVPTEQELSELMYKLSLETDAQIAYVHWGEEYAETHNATQEALAHTLIDKGVDAVIGHHPHVVQDIGMYRGKPIFYSLGNFIFDQYFDERVQEGLVVAVSLKDGAIDYELLPVTAAEVAAAPRLLDHTESATFLTKLAAVSDPAVRTDILTGRISFWHGY